MAEIDVFVEFSGETPPWLPKVVEGGMNLVQVSVGSAGQKMCAYRCSRQRDHGDRNFRLLQPSEG